MFGVFYMTAGWILNRFGGFNLFTMKLSSSAERRKWAFSKGWLTSLRDGVRGIAVQERLRVEPLHLHIKRNQLRWFRHLARMIPGHGVSGMFNERRPWHRLRTCCRGLGWSRNTSRFPQMSWRRWLWKRRLLPCDSVSAGEENWRTLLSFFFWFC